MDLAAPAVRARRRRASGRSPPTCAATARATSRRAGTTGTRWPPTWPGWSARSASATRSIVGHGCGGLLAWTVGTLHPRVVRRLAVLGAAHPLRLRAALVTDPRGQLRAAGPRAASRRRGSEHVLTRDDAAYVGELCERWSGPGWRRTADYAEAVGAAGRRSGSRRPRTARWRLPLGGPLAAAPGRLPVRAALSEPVTAPTLQLHGALDPLVLPRTAQGSGRYVVAAYEWRLLDGVGHFPHQEAPELVTGEMLRWAKD